MTVPIASTSSGALKLSLAEKLSQIAKSIGSQEPDKESKGSQRYSYFSAKAVYGWWETRLHDAGIVFYPCEIISERTEQYEQTTRSGGRMTWLTSLAVKFAVTDGIETLYVVGYGQGEDPSDKGAGKAMTYAQKNALLGMGMNGNEPDVEEFDDDRRGSRDRRQEELERDRDERRSRERDRDDDRDRGRGRDEGRDRDRDRSGDSRSSRREDDRDRDRDDDRRPDRDERRSDGGRRVEIGDGEIEGIQRGGRANKTTDVQLRKLREVAREKGLSVYQIADIVDAELGDKIDLPESGTDDPGPALVKYLEELSSVDAGKLIVALESEPSGGR